VRTNRVKLSSRVSGLAGQPSPFPSRRWAWSSRGLPWHDGTDGATLVTHLCGYAAATTGSAMRWWGVGVFSIVNRCRSSQCTSWTGAAGTSVASTGPDRQPANRRHHAPAAAATLAPSRWQSSGIEEYLRGELYGQALQHAAGICTGPDPRATVVTQADRIRVCPWPHRGPGTFCSPFDPEFFEYEFVHFPVHQICWLWNKSGVSEFVFTSFIPVA
jgi:hypothetical protein